MKVLVTGARGFLGAPCARMLGARHEVVASGRADDLTVPGAPTALIARVRPTHVLHLAWTTAHGAFWTAPDNASWVRATIELAEAAAAHGVERFVAAGSCAEYGEPPTRYGTAKHAAQLVLSDLLGERLAWGRVFFTYGPGEDPRRLVPSVIRALLRGDAAPCTHGEQVRDFLYIEDLAAAFVHLLGGDAHGALDVGSAMPVTLREVVLAAAREIGREELVRFGALAARPDEPPRLVAACAILPPTYDLTRGMRETVAYWRSRP